MKLLRVVYVLAALGAAGSFAAFWINNANVATVLSNTVESINDEGVRINHVYVCAAWAGRSPCCLMSQPNQLFLTQRAVRSWIGFLSVRGTGRCC